MPLSPPSAFSDIRASGQAAGEGVQDSFESDWNIARKFEKEKKIRENNSFVQELYNQYRVALILADGENL